MLSSWRVLPTGFSEPNLFRSSFDDTSYSIEITNLSYIWSESLTKEQILARAKFDSCIIDPSEDNNQLKVLLKKLEQALQGQEKSQLNARHIGTDIEVDYFLVNIEIPLPAPLPPLKWAFRLAPCAHDAIRSSLIIPLIRTAYAREQHMVQLIELLKAKDQTMAKVLDRVQSIGIDLSSLLPSSAIGRLGKKVVKREQLGQYAKGFEIFNEEEWKKISSDSNENSVPSNELIGKVFDANAETNAGQLARGTESLVDTASNHSQSQILAGGGGTTGNIHKSRQTEEEQHHNSVAPKIKRSANEENLEHKAIPNHILSQNISDDDDYPTDDEDQTSREPQNPARPDSKIPERSLPTRRLGVISKPKPVVGHELKRPTAHDLNEDDLALCPDPVSNNKANTKEPVRTLGKIGRRQDAATIQHHRLADDNENNTAGAEESAADAIVQEQEDNNSARADRELKRQRDYDEKSVIQPESEEDRANRKREELKLQLEQKTKEQVVKKKRKF